MTQLPLSIQPNVEHPVRWTIAAYMSARNPVMSRMFYNGGELIDTKK